MKAVEPREARTRVRVRTANNKKRANKMRLKVVSFGQSAEGIALRGDPKSPEPDHVRITFPGGDVEVTRASEGDSKTDYWVHIRVNKQGCGMFCPGEDQAASIIDARLDQTDKDSMGAKLGDFNRAELYQLAVRIHRD